MRYFGCGINRLTLVLHFCHRTGRLELQKHVQRWMSQSCQDSDIIRGKGGKWPLPFLLATWGSGGRRFKSSHPDFELETEWSDRLSGPKAKGG